MSTQRRSFFALHGAKPDHAQTRPVPKLSLSGGNVFTIVCNFYTQHNDDEDIFISQNGVFGMGMTNGTVYFEAAKLGRIQTIAAQTPIEENAWTHMTVVYDGNKLLLYLQGFLAIERVVGEGVLHIDATTPYKIGLMDGYLLEVAIYSKALTADEVRKNQFTPQVEPAKTEMLLDFDAFIPLDKGKNNLPIQLIAACNTVNIVYSLLCDKAGCAIPIGVAPINPGGQGLQSYTILVKAYGKCRAISTDAYLFANGALGQPETIAIGLSDGQTKPFFEIGTQRFAFGGIVKQGEWADVAVSVSGQDITLYLNGIASGTGRLATPFIRQAGAALTFGNILANNRFANGFTGFIDSAAVFSVALPVGRLLGYADIAPYAFDSDLAALWTFNDGEAAEVLHNAAVSMSGGTKVELCENTVLDRVVPPLAFALPDTATGLDALQTWEANTAAKAFNLCVKELTGMEPGGCFTAQGRLYGSLCSVVYNEYKDNETLGEIETKQAATPVDMGEVLKCALMGACLGIICYGMYCFHASRSNRALRDTVRFFRWMKRIYTVGTFSSTLVGGGAGALTEYCREKTAPESDKAQTDKYEISLTSLSFFNSDSEPAGALCARPDFSHPPVVPEWTDTMTSPAPALYHKNITTGKTPLLRAVFAVTLKIPGSVTIKLGAEVNGNNSLLGSLAEKSIIVSASSSQTVDFPLTKNALRGAILGKHEISWSWYYKESARHVLKTTTHQIHIIHDKPLSPWTTAKDSTCLPVYSLLCHCADIAAQKETEPEANKRFVNQLVGWTHAGTRFTARGLGDSAHYARWDQYHRKLTVDLVNFTAKLSKTASVPVTFMDIACLQLLLTRLEGLPDLYLFEIKSLFSDNIRTRTAKGLSGTALPSNFVQAYYTCGMRDATTKNATVWDAFMTLKAPDDTDFIAKGVPFSEYPCTEDLIGSPDKTRYRTLLCSEGTSCDIVMFAQQLFVGALLPQSIVPTRNETHLGTNFELNDFDVSIKIGIPLPPSIVRCHSISYHYIQKAIVSLINGMIDNKISREQCIEGLEHLVHAVTMYSAMPPIGSSAQGQARKAWVALLGTPNAPTLKDAFENNSSIPEIAELAEDLLVALNNNLKNVRQGQSDWNSSLQEKYDCNRWEYVYFGRNAEFCFGSSSEDPLADAPSGGEPERVGEGFYLTDGENDCDRLNILSTLQAGVWKHPLPHFRTGYLVDTELPEMTATNKRRPVIFSSRNKWNLSMYKIDTIPNYRIPIYILNKGGWQQLRY